MDWILVIFSFWQTFLSLFGSSINILLIYLCLYKSPKSIQVYGTLIMNFALTDLTECLADLFSEARIIPIPTESKIIYQYNGLCQFTGRVSCNYGLSILFHCLCHGLWSLLLSFSYRLYILTHAGLKRKHLLLMILIIYIPSFIQVVTFPLNLVDDSTTADILRQKLPSHNLTGLIYSRFDFRESISALFAVFHICAPIYPVYIIIFVLRRKIVRILMINANMLSKETKAVHEQMLKCLTYQAVIPAFLFVGVGVYLLAQFGIVNNPAIEFGVMTTYIPMPVLSSLTYICFVRPYREFCKGMICQTEKSRDLKDNQFNSSVSKRGTSRVQTQMSTVQC